MGTYCVPLLANPFSYFYERDFIQGFLHGKRDSLTIAFSSAIECVDGVLSLADLHSRMSIRCVLVGSRRTLTAN